MHKNNPKDISQRDFENSTEPQLSVVKFHKSKISCSIDLNGKIWVGINPICEAIGIDTKRALLTIKQDSILGAMVSEQTLLDARNRKFPMQCIPIEYVHGWLFLIQENKVNEKARPVLQAFKKECYQVLFNHFYGKYKHYEDNLGEKRKLSAEKHSLQEQIKELQKRVRTITKLENELENAALTGQFQLPVKGGMSHE